LRWTLTAISLVPVCFFFLFVTGGLRIEVFPAVKSSQETVKYFVMAATPTRHYQFIGGPTFEQLFAKYSSNPAFVELPGSYYLAAFPPNRLRFVRVCLFVIFLSPCSGSGLFRTSLLFSSADTPRLKR
jgi:hypothetical protein